MLTEDDFQFITIDIPDLKADEFLVRDIWISVDPYMRGRMREIRSYISPFQIGKPLEGGCVGQNHKIRCKLPATSMRRVGNCNVHIYFNSICCII
jgi:NADPH-dependent curcumin reductase CurA